MQFVEMREGLTESTEDETEQRISSDTSCVREHPRKFVLKDGLAVKENHNGTTHPHTMTEASKQTEEKRCKHYFYR